ncbi:DegT/DnrJ/EryC1/StrS family aminotransferase [Prosthecobacter fluviatilis]|uniref:DegT/DnrJ/EryC1/StrS family aminotransferase n=1 Tax=Prosthecobacter fluviatilis TaxID=445931 RepID=A0ABW0KKF6_9BACT
MQTDREIFHVGRPNIGDRDSLMRRINDIIDRRWLSNNGQYVQKFEARLAALLDVKHCIAVCNATVGLEIAIRAMELSGEVIIPSFTFIATAHALQWQQITPVFCDVDPITHNIDPKKVEALITPRTTAILGVHLWGRGCDVQALKGIADRHGLKLLFDAAHAFGCSHEGRMIGGFGNAEVFSFHATKFINTLEGGAITTNDDDLALKIRHMKNFGFTYYDRVESIGTNGKMNEISAAMGITNLEAMAEFISINKRNLLHYGQGLEGVPGLKLISYDSSEQCNCQYVVVEMDALAAGITRDELVSKLHEHQIFARRYFFPGCHRMEPYLTLYPEAGKRLPHTEALTQKLFCLPTGSAVDEDDIVGICRLIRSMIC